MCCGGVCGKLLLALKRKLLKIDGGTTGWAFLSKMDTTLQRRKDGEFRVCCFFRHKVNKLTTRLLVDLEYELFKQRLITLNQ